MSPRVYHNNDDSKKSILKQYFLKSKSFVNFEIMCLRLKEPFCMFLFIIFAFVKKIFITGCSVVVVTRTFTTLFVWGIQCLISQIKSALAGLPSVYTWNKIFSRFLFRKARILLQIKQNVDFNQSDGRETWWLTGQQTWRRNIMEV